MAKVKEDSHGEHVNWLFYCPGCGHQHAYYTKNPEGRPVWQFNGDVDKPTFTPSLLLRWGKHADPNWQEPPALSGVPGNWSGTCHLYVTNGQIIYLSDCTHHLAGQTVPMVDIT